MLGTTIIYYLLVNYFSNLLKIDTVKKYIEVEVMSQFFSRHTSFANIFYLISQNNNRQVQSAGNCAQRKGSSETIRQLSSLNIKNNNLDLKKILEKSRTKEFQLKQFNESNKNPQNFIRWLAGVMDGAGNFDIRKSTNNSNVFSLALKTIRIKLHNRDVRILRRIQDGLHCGRIRSDLHKPYSIYIVSRLEEMTFILNQLNGLILLKVDGFKKACNLYNINYTEGNYQLPPLDPYFSGLIDTDGSIVFNFVANRIECNLEQQYNKHTDKLNLSQVIPNYTPSVYRRKKDQGKFNSICFRYQTVNEMICLYDYFMKNRLYSDMKFYRIAKIKSFVMIRNYSSAPKESVEYKIYSSFLQDWIQYCNPLWTKVPFVKKLNNSSANL